MKPRKLPLRATNFGEWLASLGLLQLVAATGEDTPKLHFDADGFAFLHSKADDKTLISLLKETTDEQKIRVHFYTKTESKGASSGPISIGDELHYEATFALDTDANRRAFETTAETKDGCPITFAVGRGVFVRHFVGKALCELAGLRSPVKTWSGQVTFPRIFQSIRQKVAASTTVSFDEMLSTASRETQRFRFDHAWENYFDDGSASLEEGAEMRPAVEWLALAGLSFFPAEWGWKCLSPRRNVLRSYLWANPLDVSAITLALHSGQLQPAAEFQVVVGGQFEPKKIRFLSTHN